MTRREALDWFLLRVNALGDPQARNRAERSLTLAVGSLWRRRQWRDFTPARPLSLALVAGQRDYPLPAHVGRLRSDVDPVLASTGESVETLDSGDLMRLYPEVGTSAALAAGPPRVVALGGTACVHTQPSSSGEALEVLSSSSSDVAVRVSVEGEDAAGVEQRATALLTGGSPVAVGTFRTVTRFSKAYADPTDPTTELTSSVGSVTLRTVSGATALQTLLPDEGEREHRVLTVYPDPDQAYTLLVPVLLRPRRLIYDSDALPVDWDDAVLEEMLISWRVDTGELAHDASVARPKFLELLAFDQATGPRRARQPFTGGRGVPR